MKQRLILAAAVGAAMALPVPASAHGGSPSIVHGCIKNGALTVRIVAPNAACASNETARHWNVTGVKGPAGPTGATGPQGLAGPAGHDGDDGAPGANGAQGPQGPAGANGAPGPAGPQGEQGVAGENGAPGAQGDPGLQFQGDWNPSPYQIGDVVFYNGSSYVSLTDHNSALPPDQAPSLINWKPLAVQGTAGPPGTPGEDGAAGANGVDGAPGLKGDKGDKGEQGVAGTNGAPGTNGVDGAPGTNGVDGAPGTKGDPGEQGVAGTDGAPGAQGPAGATGPAGPSGRAFPIDCPPDSVLAGTTCIDIYEASVWRTTDAGTVAKIQNGTVTLTDLQAVGAVQYGATTTDYGNVGCFVTANNCVDVYAVSIPGVKPSAYISWYQAAAVAHNSGKRLPSNAEWQTAALGTQDVGASSGGSECNNSSSGSLPTGNGFNCVSHVGAYDMVGNVTEWVADWVSRANTCNSGGFNQDYNCLVGAATGGSDAGAAALVRGGSFIDGAGAGVFAVQGFSPPGLINGRTGFRAAR